MLGTLVKRNRSKSYTYYGSCSGCDTLMGINHYGEGLPSKEQMEKYMTLCLHLVEKCKFMGEEVEQ